MFKSRSGDSYIEGDFSKLEKLLKNLKTNHYVDVGILGNAYTKKGIAIAGIGAVHEFGMHIKVTPKMRGYLKSIGIGLKATTTHIKIPERSFIRMPIEHEQDKIEKQVQSKLEGLLAEGDIEGVFKIMGLACEAAIQEAFETGGFGEWQDISEITKKLKGSSSILIDRGDLRKAISSKVGKGS